MRDMAIKMMRSIGTFAGGCNVQFAVSPDEKEDIVAIEINPRVSRSSALASKQRVTPLQRLLLKWPLVIRLMSYSIKSQKQQRLILNQR
jgi:carbamoyl-phosphate synthase large subunit